MAAIFWHTLKGRLRTASLTICSTRAYLAWLSDAMSQFLAVFCIGVRVEDKKRNQGILRTHQAIVLKMIVLRIMEPGRKVGPLMRLS